MNQRMKLTWDLIKATFIMLKRWPFQCTFFPIVYLLLDFIFTLSIGVAAGWIPIDLDLARQFFGFLNFINFGWNELSTKSFASQIITTIAAIGIKLLRLFSLVALFTAISKLFRNETISLVDALRRGWFLKQRICAWAVLLVLLDLGLYFLKDFPLGKFLYSVFNSIFNLMTYFVIPILIFEGLPILEASRRSFLMFRQRWIELILGLLGISLPIIILCLLLLLGGFSVPFLTVKPLLAISLSFLCSAIFISITTAETIFLVTLYVQAVEGVLPTPIESDALNENWILKDKTEETSNPLPPVPLEEERWAKHATTFSSWIVSGLFWVILIFLAKTTAVFGKIFRDFHVQFFLPIKAILFHPWESSILIGTVFTVCLIWKDYLMKPRKAITLNLMVLLFAILSAIGWGYILISHILNTHELVR